MLLRLTVSQVESVMTDELRFALLHDTCVSWPQSCWIRIGLFSDWLYVRLLSTHPFNGPLSGTTRVSRYQKGKTSLKFTEVRDCEWQWHQLGHMQVFTSLQTRGAPDAEF